MGQSPAFSERNFIMKKLNVAIIGQGRSGRDIHGSYFLSDASKEYYNVVAIVDKMECRRERAKAEFGCDVYEDYTELFGRNDIDLVINSTFSHMHYPVTMDLLQHGLNVVVEKPFANRAQECEMMIKTAKENGCVLTVFQQSRLAPYYKKIDEIIKSGVLGDLIQVTISFSGYARRWDWQCSKRFGGGGLYNTGPHPLDQALDIMNLPDGEMPQIFSKLAKVNLFGDADDYAKVIMTYPGRPLLDVEISSCNGYSDFNYKIHGSKGSLKATLSKVEWKYFNPENEAKRELILEPLTKEDGVTPSYCTETLKWTEHSEDLAGSAFNIAVEDYYERMYKTLTEGAELFIKPEKITTLIRVAEAVHAQNPMETIY